MTRIARRSPPLVLLLLAALGGCAVARRATVAPLPFQRVVVGGVDLSRFPIPRGVLAIVRADGTAFEHVTVEPGRAVFAIALPPGRYRVTELRAISDSRAPQDATHFPLSLAFDLADVPASYVGTLALSSRSPRTFEAQVVDDYDATLQEVRRLYSDVPPEVTRGLMQAVAPEPAGEGLFRRLFGP
jgi:hypothetical protein